MLDDIALLRLVTSTAADPGDATIANAVIDASGYQRLNEMKDSAEGR